MPGAMDLDMNDENDEDQMLRAIAMSLGGNAVVSTDQVSEHAGASVKKSHFLILKSLCLCQSLHLIRKNCHV